MVEFPSSKSYAEVLYELLLPDNAGKIGLFHRFRACLAISGEDGPRTSIVRGFRVALEGFAKGARDCGWADAERRLLRALFATGDAAATIQTSRRLRPELDLTGLSEQRTQLERRLTRAVRFWMAAEGVTRPTPERVNLPSASLDPVAPDPSAQERSAAQVLRDVVLATLLTPSGSAVEVRARLRLWSGLKDLLSEDDAWRLTEPLHRTIVRVALVPNDKNSAQDGCLADLELMQLNAPSLAGQPLIIEPFSVGLQTFDGERDADGRWMPTTFRAAVEQAVDAAWDGLALLHDRQPRPVNHLADGPILARFKGLTSGVPSLSGGSGGGALAVGVMALATRVPTDRAVISLVLRRGEGSDGSAVWSCENVGSLALKAKLCGQANIDRLIVAGGQDDGVTQTTDHGVTVVRAGNMVQAYDQLTGRAAAAVKALRQAAWTALRQEVQFLPPHLQDADGLAPADAAKRVLAFLFEPRVCTQGDYARHEQDRERETALAAGEPGYVHITSERYDRDDQRRREPLRVVPLTDHMTRHVARRWVLVGEPGEGKTTALVARFARLCLELADRIERGETSLDAADVRLPLMIPLRIYAPEIERDGKTLRGSVALLRQAVEHLTETLLDGADLAPRERAELRDWLDAKAAAKAVTLHLDALDEWTQGDPTALSTTVVTDQLGGRAPRVT